MSPLPFGFGKKPQTGSVSKEGPPLGGGLPPATEPNAPPPAVSSRITDAKIDPITFELVTPKTPEAILKEKETVTETSMIELMDQMEQKVAEQGQFFVKFGLRKGEVNRFRPENPPTPDDSRVLLLVTHTPQSEDEFVVVTKKGPMIITAKSAEESARIRKIIDQAQILGSKMDFIGGTTRGQNGKSTGNEMVIGYEVPSGLGVAAGGGQKDNMNLDIKNLTTAPLEVFTSTIQDSVKLIQEKEAEKNKPFLEAIETETHKQEVAQQGLDFLKNLPSRDSAGQGSTPPPPAPTA